MSNRHRAALAGLMLIGILTGCGEEDPKVLEARKTALTAGDPVAWLKTKPLTECENNFLDASFNDGDLTIVSKQSATWLKAKDVRFMMRYAMTCYAPELFKNFPKIQKLETRFDAELVDQRGNTSTGTIARIAVSRKNSDTIHWENVRTENVPKIADYYWESPVVARIDDE